MKPSVSMPTPLHGDCPAPAAPLLGGLYSHVFLWSTKTCRGCGLTLERFDGSAVRFANGDAPRPEEWERYHDLCPAPSIFRYYGPGGTSC